MTMREATKVHETHINRLNKCVKIITMIFINNGSDLIYSSDIVQSDLYGIDHLLFRITLRLDSRSRI